MIVSHLFGPVTLDTVRSKIVIELCSITLRLLLAVTLLAFLPASAMATIMISFGASLADTDPVLFTEIGLINDSVVVQGRVDNGLSDTAEFAGSELLHTGSVPSGVGPVSGTYDYMAMSVDFRTFTKLVWNLVVPEGGIGTVAFVIDGIPFDGPDPGTQTDVFDLAEGDNFFTIEASGGMTMSRVEFQTVEVELSRTTDIQVGGIEDAPVPEPGTLPTALAALAGLAVASRRAWSSN